MRRIPAQQTSKTDDRVVFPSFRHLPRRQGNLKCPGDTNQLNIFAKLRSAPHKAINCGGKQTLHNERIKTANNYCKALSRSAQLAFEREMIGVRYIFYNTRAPDGHERAPRQLDTKTSDRVLWLAPQLFSYNVVVLAFYQIQGSIEIGNHHTKIGIIPRLFAINQVEAELPWKECSGTREVVFSNESFAQSQRLQQLY